ncbi:MAG: acyltransferase family protein [Bacteroidaceae bacterium]|nr:acyltransferase family protein [Bacteroidaceae bacterium]
MQKRDNSIDFIKCVLILLVVLGHSIQYCMTQEGAYYFEVPLFVFIYSFHMQMFAFVSGLFVSKSLSLSFWDVIKKRFAQLIIPSIFWSGVVTNIVWIFVSEKKRDLNSFLMYFVCSPLAYWFLYSLFLSILCLWTANKIKEKSVFVVLISVVLLFVLPVGDLRYVKFIYPFYIAGYYYSLCKNSIDRQWKLVTVILLVLYCILIPFWNRTSYFYLCGLEFLYFEKGKILFNLAILKPCIYRIIVGLASSVAFMYILQYVYRKCIVKVPSEMFLYIGRHSMAIYMIHFIILNVWYRLVDVTSLMVLKDYYSLYVLSTFFVVVGVTVGLIYLVPSFKHRKLIFGW